MPELTCLPELLLPWFAENRRDLPWRRDREPYHVWLSEIMLQQTRVEAVRGYYARFLQRLPTVEALAGADEDVLLKLWEGLGYYSRVRNLQRAAQELTRRGGFPQTVEELERLPGIGAYTAGAIASICFEQKAPAVDGNVLRVLTRFLASDACIDQPRVRRDFAGRLRGVYPAGHCGDFTQALMELGATVCVPNGAPQCARCPLQDVCAAHRSGRELQFPVRAEKRAKRVEQRTVLLMRCGDRLAVCKRPERGLLAGLWQFPDVEGEQSAQQALALAAQWGVHPTGIERVVSRSHIFTHVRWELTGVLLTCAVEAPQFRWVTQRELETEIGLPTAYRQFLTCISP